MKRSIISSLLTALALAAGSAFAGAPPIELAKDAPDRYVVVKGDTLWDISGKFLQKPWRWPEIWRMNQAQIKNPHLIYPGDIVLLDRSGPVPRLRLGRAIRGTNGGSGKLQPQIHVEDGREEIPSIPPSAIEPFLSQPLIIDANGMEKAGRIVATREDRVMTGAGDSIYAVKIDNKVALHQMFRPAKPLKDPETDEILGYEAFFLGNARLTRKANADDVSSLQIESAKQEVGRGDYLLPAVSPTMIRYMPRAPEKDVRGRVIGVYGGVGEAGRNSIVSLARGKRDGLEVGHVLALYRTGGTTTNRVNDVKETVSLPDERYGLLFVFRTFERISYALVMETSRPVKALDRFRSP